MEEVRNLRNTYLNSKNLSNPFRSNSEQEIEWIVNEKFNEENLSQNLQWLKKDLGDYILLRG